VTGISDYCHANPFQIAAALTIVVLFVFLSLLPSEADKAAEILVEPGDNAKYQIQWSWDSNSSRSVGLIHSKIRITDESSHKFVGYVADEKGTRLTMYNDEQVVMAKFYLQDGFATDWTVVDSPYKGYFAIAIPPQFVGKVQSAKIFINNHMYAVDDGTATTKESWVFTNSAYTVYKLGSLLRLGPLTLGFENLPNVAISSQSVDDIKENAKFDVRVFDKIEPIFLTHLRNVIIEYHDGLPLVWYEPAVRSTFEDEVPSIRCKPSPGSVFAVGNNIVKCLVAYESEQPSSSYFTIEVPQDPYATSGDDVMPVQIDINPFYPGSNAVKLRYTTLVSIAILGNVSLNVQEVNQNGLQFGPNGASSAATGSYLTDVNGDGFNDLVLKFDVLDAGLHEGYRGNVCVMGLLDDGQTGLKGCDNIEVIAR
jgi:hypothetical protein